MEGQDATSNEPRRTRILALHGKQANNAVTKLQLENLKITEEAYDIVYLRGTIQEEHGHPELETIVDGPFYSWIDESSEVAKEKSLQEAVSNVNTVLGELGPFDGIYGFSSGALIAAIVVNMMHDPVLKMRFIYSGHGSNLSESMIDISFNGRSATPAAQLKMSFATSSRELSAVGLMSKPSRSLSVRKRNMNSSKRANSSSIGSTTTKTQSLGLLGSGLNTPENSLGFPIDLNRSRKSLFLDHSFRPRAEIDLNKSRKSLCLDDSLTGNDLGEGMEDELNSMSDEEESTESADMQPLKFIIMVCAAAPCEDMDQVRTMSKCKRSFFPGSNRKTPSFHIIATEDKNKRMSEDWAMVFSHPYLMYISSDHSVGREQRNDHELLHNLSRFIKYMGRPRTEEFFPRYRPVSRASSIAVLPHKQVSLVRLIESNIPGGGFSGLRKRGAHVGATIIEVLKAEPRDKPFLYNAREKDPKFTTYGELSDFILGAGKLSKLGVQQNEVVAYGCPAGATALAAVAFLSIASGGIAAPLAPNTSEADTLDSLEQFNAKYLIVFEGVECPEVNAAFQKYSSQGKAKIIRAYIPSDTSPGIFAYRRGREIDTTYRNAVYVSSKQQESFDDNKPCLLLRTSGTTSRPKGVPLTERALIRNGAILASSLGLTENDVCYSVMPLFHIGGLSASILSTLASGGAVCCETMPFNAERMVDALATSNPKPTWYSSVPTIHNATVQFIKSIGNNTPTPEASSGNVTTENKYTEYGIMDGSWVAADRNEGKGHALRFIRSGAAELLDNDAVALSQMNGDIPVIPTYSMSEQMPITQPPVGKHDMIDDKPGSVGVSIAASVAIVNGSLRPLPHGEVGELAISGSTVMKHYLDNLDADRKSFFYLPLDIVGTSAESMGRYFLTGDTGMMDKDGFIKLNGRTKELIKKGGEQISPVEVEDVLQNHRWVQKAICFSVPSKLYGEAVGAAIILSKSSPTGIELDEIISEMRIHMKMRNFDQLKWPMRWKLVTDGDLPKTKTHKYIRIGLSKVLGLDDDAPEMGLSKQQGFRFLTEKTASIDYNVLSGLRFVLACYVMFMHIGSNHSWGAFSNLRGSPWHVHTFFLLAGYIMASPMGPKINHKFKYVAARIGSMYTLYFLAVLFGLANLLVSCRPSTFREDFTWHSKPDDLRTEPFCEGTPLFPRSYWGSLVFTLISYFSGLTITPFWALHWWLGYYLWFIAMYNQCLMIFPFTYNLLLTRRRKQRRFLVGLTVTLVGASIIIVMTMWFAALSLDDNAAEIHQDGGNVSEDGSYKEESNGNKSDEWLHNSLVLGFYLFAPFWMIHFIIGIVLAFVYDAYRPKETHHAKRYGYIADACTVAILALSIIQTSQGFVDESGVDEPGLFLRPAEANNPYQDDAITNRLWDNVYGRLFCPITTVWIYALSTGEGLTARLLRNKLLVSVLAPNSYGCFVFHQMVGQWYYAATRNGLWWSWWNYRKEIYWFSPKPIPVEWFEYPYIVGLVILFTRFITKHVEPRISPLFVGIGTGGHDLVDNDKISSSGKLMLSVVMVMTGVEATMSSTLEECGLGSIGMPIVVSTLNKILAKEHKDVAVNVSDMIQAKSVAEMVAVIDIAKARASDSGI